MYLEEAWSGPVQQARARPFSYSFRFTLGHLRLAAVTLPQLEGHGAWSPCAGMATITPPQATVRKLPPWPESEGPVNRRCLTRSAASSCRGVHPGPVRTVRHALVQCIPSHSCAMGYVGSAFHAPVSSVRLEHSRLLTCSTLDRRLICFSDCAAPCLRVPSGSGCFTNGFICTQPYTGDST